MFEMYGARKPTSSYGTRKSRLFSMGKKGGNNDLCDHLALFQLPVPIGAITNICIYICTHQQTGKPLFSL